MNLSSSMQGENPEKTIDEDHLHANVYAANTLLITAY